MSAHHHSLAVRACHHHLADHPFNFWRGISHAEIPAIMYPIPTPPSSASHTLYHSEFLKGFSHRSVAVLNGNPWPRTSSIPPAERRIKLLTGGKTYHCAGREREDMNFRRWRRSHRRISFVLVTVFYLCIKYHWYKSAFFAVIPCIIVLLHVAARGATKSRQRAFGQD